MALTLTANIDADDRILQVTGTLPDPLEVGYLFRIDDEVLSYLGPDRSSVTRIVEYKAGDLTRWRVSRAYGNSVAASHTAGASILGARDAWTSGDDEDQPDPFDETLATLPIATSDVDGLDGQLAGKAEASALEALEAATAPIGGTLTDTDATLAQFSEVLDTRRTKALGLYIEILGGANDQALNCYVFTRATDRPWVPCIFLELLDPVVWDLSTYYGILGTGPGGTTIPTVAFSTAHGLLDETVVVAQPMTSLGTTPASCTVTFDSEDTLTFVHSKPTTPGDFANAFSVQFIDPGEADHPLRIQSPDGYTFQIVCETDSNGDITTTPNAVQDAMLYDSAPWFVRFDGSTGTNNPVNATAAIPFTGGDAGASGVTYAVTW